MTENMRYLIGAAIIALVALGGWYYYQNYYAPPEEKKMELKVPGASIELKVKEENSAPKINE